MVHPRLCVAPRNTAADFAPDELAGYFLHAVSAAHDLPPNAAVRRLVTVRMAGLRPS